MTALFHDETSKVRNIHYIVVHNLCVLHNLWNTIKIRIFLKWMET